MVNSERERPETWPYRRRVRIGLTYADVQRRLASEEWEAGAVLDVKLWQQHSGRALVQLQGERERLGRVAYDERVDSERSHFIRNGQCRRPFRKVEENLRLLHERLIQRLAPLSTFFIMPTFALANTAVPLGGIAASSAGAAMKFAAVVPAAGVSTGLLIGKPLGIFGSTWLAIKLGVAQMPTGERGAGVEAGREARHACQLSVPPHDTDFPTAGRSQA